MINSQLMKINYSVTTVKIEEGLKEKLKILAIQNGMKLQDLINEVLKEAVIRLEKQTGNKND